MLTTDEFRFLRRGTIALFAATAVATAGCSFSYSSESSSDSSKSSSESSSSPSESSSESSAKDESSETEYEEDVAAYTSAHVVAGGSNGAFLNGISDLATKRGISNWESDRATWVGIGAGLAKADLHGDEFAAYKETWSGGDAAAMSGIQQGYDQKR